MTTVKTPKRKPLKQKTDADPGNPWPGKIVAVRKELDITQHRMAEMIGVPVRTLMSWEYGHRRPSRLAQLRLKQLFPKI